MKISDDMVERGAQAIYLELLMSPPRRGWNGIPELVRKNFRREARACLEAAMNIATEVLPHPLLISSGEVDG